MLRVSSIATLLALSAACATSGPSGAPPPPAPSPDDPIDVVAQPDRSREDRALDAVRNPGELLAFLGVKSGMKVADLAAGGGYTTELLARAVGPTGKVYSQNNRFIVEKFADKPWSERLAKPTGLITS